MVSATLSQPIPFKRHRFRIHLNLSKHTGLFSNSNSYRIFTDRKFIQDSNSYRIFT
jgi:hypothetical protein